MVNTDKMQVRLRVLDSSQVYRLKVVVRVSGLMDNLQVVKSICNFVNIKMDR